MKLRHFLDAAYALLVDEYQRLGMNLIEATDKLNTAAQTTSSEERPESSVVSQNEASLKHLEQMMGGVG